MSPLPVYVAVGVIVNDVGQILIARRPSHVHQGDLWEFPGGKLEKGEDVLGALKRELYEELAISVRSAESFLRIQHDYNDKSVVLDVWKVTAFEGEPQGLEGQPLRWVSVNSLVDYSFPDANQEIIDRLIEHEHV